MNVFQRVLQRYEYEKNKPIHKVVQYPFSIGQQKEYVMEKLMKSDRVSFNDLIEERPEKILAIYNFLAILELLQLRLITLHLGEGFNNFWIERIEGELVDG